MRTPVYDWPATDEGRHLPTYPARVVLERLPDEDQGSRRIADAAAPEPHRQPDRELHLPII